jgi:hypothetical protein
MAWTFPQKPYARQSGPRCSAWAKCLGKTGRLRSNPTTKIDEDDNESQATNGCAPQHLADQARDVRQEAILHRTTNVSQLSTEKRNFVLAITFHGNPLSSYKLDCAHHAPRRASKYADAVTEKPPPAGAGTAVVAEAQSQDEGHARQRNQHRSTRSLPDLRRSYEAFRDADVRVQTLRSRAYGRAGIRRFAERREIARSKKPQSRVTSRVRRPASPYNSTNIARVSEREREGQKLTSRTCLINTIHKLTIRGASEDKALPAKRLHGRVSGSKGCGDHGNLHQS